VGLQFSDEAWHLFFKRFTIVLDFFRSDIAARRENVTVRGDFGSGGRFAEASDVGIGWRL